MKVDKLTVDEPDKLQVQAVKPARTETRVDSIIQHKGHTLFEINPVTGKCKVAEYEQVDATLSGSVHKKVIAHQNCVYVSALNKKNALIKYFKMVGKQIERMNQI